MQEGFLATPHAIRFAVTYLVFQAVLVIFTISSAFRLMTYHLYFHDTDVSKMISIPVLWEIVQFNRQRMQKLAEEPEVAPPGLEPAPAMIPGPARRLHQATADDPLRGILESYVTRQTPALIPGHARRLHQATPDDELRGILESYVTRQTPAIHLYSGMFDSRFVLHSQIESLLHRTVQESFPFKLQIDSLDSVVLLYALSLAFIGFLFYNLHQKARAKEQTASASDVDDISGDFLLFDMLFWANLTLLAFVFFDVSSTVSSPLLSGWQAFVYTILLYAVCLPKALQRHAQICVMAAWCLHVLMITSVGHAGVDNGGVVLVAHLILLVFTYVSTTEAMTELKFLNLRVWCAVFLNVLFLFLYLGNVELITNATTG